MQKYSLFHASSETVLKNWHRPYVELFTGVGTVLDLGCGLGYFADLLREVDVKSLGLDVDPEMVAASKKRGHDARLTDVTQLQAENGTYGGVHISHVVEHLWGDEVVRLLESCWNLLEDEGIIVIRTPNWQIPEVRNRVFWLDHTHKRPYPNELLIKLLSDIGFSVMDAGEEPYGLKDLYVVARRTASSQASPLKVKFDQDASPAHSNSAFRRSTAIVRCIKRAIRNAWAGLFTD